MPEEIYRIVLGVDIWDEEMPRKVKEMGCNIAHCFGAFASHDTLDTQRDLVLSRCQAHGIKLMPYVTYRSAKYTGLLESQDIGNIQTYSSHPALFGWQLFEEPGNEIDRGNITPANLKQAIQARYNQVKAVCPNLPLGITSCINLAWRDPYDALDIFLPNNYCCNPGKTDAQTIETLEHWHGIGTERGNWILDLINKGKIIIPTLQAYIRSGEDPEYLRGKIALQYNWWKDTYKSPHVSYFVYSHILAYPVIYDGVKELNEELAGALVYPCPYCRATFSSQEELDAHIASEHPGVAVYYSEGERDGYVHETGAVNTDEPTMRVKIYPGYTRRGFVSFDTSDIPDNAVIDAAYLRVYVDHFEAGKNKGGTINVNYLLYGTLEVGDYDRTPQAANIATIKPGTSDGVWVNSSNFTQVNKAGRSQYRLQYDAGEDISVYLGSGNGSHAPELHLAWHIGEEFTTEDITCSTCESNLRITRSSIVENNRSLNCPICGKYVGEGTKVEVLSAPLIDRLREQIRALDAKVVEIEKAIIAVRTQIDAIKKDLGL